MTTKSKCPQCAGTLDGNLMPEYLVDGVYYDTHPPVGSNAVATGAYACDACGYTVDN